MIVLPVQQKSSPKTFREDFAKTCANYGVAEGVGEEVVLMVVFVSVFSVVAGEGFTTVVLVSFFSPPGGFTVSVFCSQAANNDAAPARMQMYFFIRLWMKTQCGSFHNRRNGPFRPYLERMFILRVSQGLQSKKWGYKADHVPQPPPEW
jgi:hypothetical protein